MEDSRQEQYYAREGEFATISGNPYVGPYSITPAGVLVSINNETIVQVSGRQAAVTPPISTPQPNITLNENDTEYDLLPVRINNPPIIVRSMAEASVPRIKPAALAGLTEEDCMFLFEDGAVKVHAGTTITLQIEAEQPDTLNVENGELIVKPSKAELLYQWTFDGVPVSLFERDESQRATKVVQGNKLVITNMIPKWAGLYNCVVSNDIGPTDGGSVNLEVYNSDVDSLFYTNLVTNPNGLAEDNTLSTEGWESVTGEVAVASIARDTVGERDKSIITDPFNSKVKWTQEMMFPRPYQVDEGILQNSPIANIQSYFTRQKYQYAFNQGTTVMQIYQDIDLTDLEDHIKGSIYGVSGVGAIISCYLGMAIYNYEPAYPYITPDLRARSSNYYLGSARLSFQNYYKMGPGFVKERAYVDIEEYSIGERVVSMYNGSKQINPIRIIDPWNSRLPKYDNQIYYQGGQDYLAPDGPSKGDNRDRHLWVADELFPTQDSRYTFGQYAEFNKVIINKLNPKTDKIRLIYTVESLGDLDYTIYDRGRDIHRQITNGILECPGWEGSWNSDTAEDKLNDPQSERNVFRSIQANYKANKSWPDSIEERVPKASDSRALATGFNVSLVPLEVGRDNESVLKNTYTLNTKVERLVPSPIQNIPPYVAGDIGLRNLDITFRLASSTEMQIQLLATIPNLPQVEVAQVPYSPGLLPLTGNSIAKLPQAARINTINNVLRSTTIQNTSPQTTIKSTNALISPYYLDSNVNISFIELDPKGVFKGERINSTKIAPRLPLNWYTIAREDRLALANEETPTSDYSKWAIPGKPLAYQQYLADWTTAYVAGDDQAYISNNIEAVDEVDAQWNRASRFLITIGVHNTNVPANIQVPTPLTGETVSVVNRDHLHAIDNYYLDFIENDVVIHKTPKLYGLGFLPSFDVEEEMPLNERTRLQLSTTPIKPSEDEDVILYNYDTTQVDMVPIVVPVSQASGDSSKVATFEIPTTLLTQARALGGLNIPQIENELGESIPDPTYKVYIYGIRPTPVGAQITNYKQANTAQDVEISNNKLTGTPLSGLDEINGRSYTITNIGVQNQTERTENLVSPLFITDDTEASTDTNS